MLNDDTIAPGRGFPAHAHRDMEIVTFVRQGAITHKDSLGNEGQTGAGEIQAMSAGTGISHSEYNLEGETTRLFQLWIRPRRTGIAPHWAQRDLMLDGRAGFVALASGFAEDGDALPIEADARVLGAMPAAGATATWALAPGRHAYLVVARGVVEIGRLRLVTGDGAAIRDETTIAVTAREPSELILVDSA